MSKLPICPHCNFEDGVYINAQWRGPAVLYFGSDGQHMQTNNEGMYTVGGTTIRCSSCEKIRRDLWIDDFVILPKE